ncbi:MAG: hypothetical protein F6K41_07285 [Symploca sp. SIO3E6]|nr:hypothetical protein [Caldora sp. SIO3E6]
MGSVGGVGGKKAEGEVFELIRAVSRRSSRIPEPKYTESCPLKVGSFRKHKITYNKASYDGRMNPRSTQPTVSDRTKD